MNAVVMRDSLVDLKDTLYDIIMKTGDPQKYNDVKMQVNQAMSVTPAARKDNSVVMIQTQNVNVQLVTERAVDGLKMIDKLLLDLYRDETATKEIEVKSVEKSVQAVMTLEELIDECCSQMLGRGYTLKDARNYFEGNYVKAALSRYEKQIDAAKFLDISQSHMSHVVKRRGLKEDEDA